MPQRMISHSVPRFHTFSNLDPITSHLRSAMSCTSKRVHLYFTKRIRLVLEIPTGSLVQTKGLIILSGSIANFQMHRFRLRIQTVENQERHLYESWYDGVAQTSLQKILVYTYRNHLSLFRFNRKKILLVPYLLVLCIIHFCLFSGHRSQSSPSERQDGRVLLRNSDGRDSNFVYVTLSYYQLHAYKQACPEYVYKNSLLCRT